MSLALDEFPRDPERLLQELQQIMEVVTQQNATIASLQAERDTVLAERDTVRAACSVARSECDAAQAEIEKLKLLIRQLQLALEDLEQTMAAAEAAQEAPGSKDGAPHPRRARRRNLGALPAHLPRVEVLVDVADKSCPCCGGTLHAIGESQEEMLDIVPAQLRVKVIRRPRYGCRACEGAVVQAPARPITGGMATEALLAQVLVSKYADFLPLYRQAQIFARQGIKLDRSTLCDWVERACCRSAGEIQLAFCWAHCRRRFYEIHQATGSALAEEAVRRIGALYRIETEIRGRPGEERHAVRQERSRPLVEALHGWLGAQLEQVSARSNLAEAIRYALRHWQGLVRFLDDGRLELDTNTIERTIRSVALTRKNSLFAGNDGGARHWAIVAGLVASAKLNGVEPLAWLTDVLERMVSGRTKATKLERLLPWNWKPQQLADPVNV